MLVGRKGEPKIKEIIVSKYLINKETLEEFKSFSGKIHSIFLPISRKKKFLIKFKFSKDNRKLAILYPDPFKPKILKVEYFYQPSGLYYFLFSIVRNLRYHKMLSRKKKISLEKLLRFDIENSLEFVKASNKLTFLYEKAVKKNLNGASHHLQGKKRKKSRKFSSPKKRSS